LSWSLTSFSLVRIRFAIVMRLIQNVPFRDAAQTCCSRSPSFYYSPLGKVRRVAEIGG